MIVMKRLNKKAALVWTLVSIVLVSAALVSAALVSCENAVSPGLGADSVLALASDPVLTENLLTVNGIPEAENAENKWTLNVYTNNEAPGSEILDAAAFTSAAGAGYLAATGLLLDTGVSGTGVSGTGVSGTSVSGTSVFLMEEGASVGQNFLRGGIFLFVITYYYSGVPIDSRYEIAVLNADACGSLDWAAMRSVPLDEYTVVYDTDADTGVPKTISVEKGGRLEMPELPKKEGYTFAGWFTEPDGRGREWDFDNDIVTKNIVFYAEWEANLYTVTFDSRGGSPAISKISVSYGGKAVKPVPAPVFEGLALVGWFTEPEYMTEWLFRSDTVTEDITLYAKWTESYYTVTFDAVDGSPLFSQNVAHGNAADKPEDPVAPVYAGQIFDIWQTGSGAAYDFELPVTGDIMLHAKWLPLYTVSFDTGVGGPVVPVQRVKEGDTVTRPPDPVQTGLTFYNWTDSSESIGTEYQFGFPVTADINIVAVYLATLTFDSRGGGVVEAQTVLRGGTVRVPPEPSKRAGFDFDGWYTASGIPFNFSATLNSDATAYARWDVTVTFDSMGGSSVAAQRISEGAKAAKPGNPTRFGLDFAGWYTTPNPLTEMPETEDGMETDEGEPFNFFTPVNISTTIYARWNVVVSFNIPGGGTIEKRIVLEGGTVTEPDTPPERDGRHTFDGWYTAPVGGVGFNFTRSITANTTVYARWGVMLTFDSRGGSTVASVALKEGATAVMPANPSKPGYTFAGWFTHSGGVGFQWDFANSAFTENTTLYARWEPNRYKINLELYTYVASSLGSSTLPTKSDLAAPFTNAWMINGGYDSYEFTYGDEAVMAMLLDYIQTHPPYGDASKFPQNIDNTNFSITHAAERQPHQLKFAGWYYNKNMSNFDNYVKSGYKGNKVDFNTITAKSFTSDVTFYAKWIKVFVVGINTRSLGGVAGEKGSVVEVKYVEDGAKVTLPNQSFWERPTVFSQIHGFYVKAIDSGSSFISNAKWDFTVDGVWCNMELYAKYEYDSEKRWATDNYYYRGSAPYTAEPMKSFVIWGNGNLP
jgi:uncharacterized repeat protein (TIGR02543 family)